MTTHYDFLAIHEEALRKAATQLAVNGRQPLAAARAKEAHDLVAAEMEEEKRREAISLLNSSSEACAQDAAAEVLEDISRRLAFLENAMAKPKRAKKRKGKR